MRDSRLKFMNRPQRRRCKQLVWKNKHADGLKKKNSDL